MNKDNINPSHYKDECSLECIESMLIAFGAEAVFDFCTCNAYKYLWRYKYKNGSEDLSKANWYVNRAEKIYNAFTPDKRIRFDYSKFEKVLLLRDILVDKFIEVDATKANEEMDEEDFLGLEEEVPF